jgi:hypothetical protein
MVITLLAAFKVTFFTHIFVGVFWRFRVTHNVTNCHYVSLKYAQTKTGASRPQIPENISYAHKHEKYPKGYYHKVFKKTKIQKYLEKYDPTFIFVGSYFSERLWYFVNF